MEHDHPVELPSNIEAEQGLLGSILISNDALLEVPSFFRVEHFHEPVHQRIYDAIRDLAQGGKTANPITLKAQFDNDPDLAKIGGARYLVKLAKDAGVIHIPDYCELVTHCWMRREMIRHYQAQIAEALAGRSPPDQLAAASAENLFTLASAATAAKPTTNYDVAVRILERLHSNFEPYSTGFSRLDKAMEGGLYPGCLYGFAAVQKAGKTVMAGTISHHLSLAGHKHLFICAEMSDDEIYQRTLARLMGCYSSAFRNGYGKSQHFRDALSSVIAKLPKGIYFENRPGITLSELVQIITLYAKRHQITGFVLDYWQLVGGERPKETTAKHLDRVAQTLADLCKRYKLWGITMAQLNREGEFRDGDGLLNACDQGYILHRPDPSLPQTWLEMKRTRYTQYMNIGDKIMPGFLLKDEGPYFEQV